MERKKLLDELLEKVCTVEAWSESGDCPYDGVLVLEGKLSAEAYHSPCGWSISKAKSGVIHLDADRVWVEDLPAKYDQLSHEKIRWEYNEWLEYEHSCYADLSDQELATIHNELAK